MRKQGVKPTLGSAVWICSAYIDGPEKVNEKAGLLNAQLWCLFVLLVLKPCPVSGLAYMLSPQTYVPYPHTGKGGGGGSREVLIGESA